MINVNTDKAYNKYTAVVNVATQLRAEIKELWNDVVIRAVLKRRRIRLDSSAE